MNPWLPGRGPCIVLPVYTRCTMSVPVLARMLVQQTSQIGGGAPYRVLIFSFVLAYNAAEKGPFRLEKRTAGAMDAGALRCLDI